MPCALTSDYSYVGCKGGAGGIRRVLITEYANVDKTTTVIASGVITTLGMVTTKEFKEYLLDKEMGMFTDNMAQTLANGTIVYTPVIDFTVKGLSTSLIQELKLVSQNTLMMIVEDETGSYWMFGYGRGMDLLTASKESGTALGDFRGQKLHFEGKESEPIYGVSSGIIAALLSPAA